MSYDPKCYDLALHFMEDHYARVPPKKVEDLAQVIQEAIEDYLQERERESQMT